MKLNDLNGTALRSGFVAPALVPAGAYFGGGLCPQGGVLVSDEAAPMSRKRTQITQVTVPSAAVAGTFMGPQSWSPPIM